jgi:hypothetical protein
MKNDVKSTSGLPMVAARLAPHSATRLACRHAHYDRCAASFRLFAPASRAHRPERCGALHATTSGATSGMSRFRSLPSPMCLSLLVPAFAEQVWISANALEAFFRTGGAIGRVTRPRQRFAGTRSRERQSILKQQITQICHITVTLCIALTRWYKKYAILDAMCVAIVAFEIGKNVYREDPGGRFAWKK